MLVWCRNMDLGHGFAVTVVAFDPMKNSIADEGAEAAGEERSVEG